MGWKKDELQQQNAWVSRKSRNTNQRIWRRSQIFIHAKCWSTRDRPPDWMVLRFKVVSCLIARMHGWTKAAETLCLTWRKNQKEIDMLIWEMCELWILSNVSILQKIFLYDPMFRTPEICEKEGIYLNLCCPGIPRIGSGNQNKTRLKEKNASHCRETYDHLKYLYELRQFQVTTARTLKFQIYSILSAYLTDLDSPFKWPLSFRLETTPSSNPSTTVPFSLRRSA